jgi:hypothetical protein
LDAQIGEVVQAKSPPVSIALGAYGASASSYSSFLPGAVVVEGVQYSGSLIPPRLRMEFGREAFDVPGNVSQAVNFAPNRWIRRGAKLVTNGAAPVQAILV